MEQIRVCTFDGPGAQPVIRSVPWPKIPKKAALIKVGACGVCGTDLHILKGHWPKPLPWPFTLGHEIGGVLVEVGSEFREDFMSKKLTVGSKVMIPPLMPCGHCYYCIHYPQSANKCLTPVYYGRYLGFDKAPHLWGGWAEYVYVDLEMLRDGGTYVEMGQFTDAGSINTSWHRICTQDLNVLGSWGFTGNDLPLGVDMLYRTRDKYPWLEMQSLYPFSTDGIGRAVADAMAMKTVKSTIVPWPELAE